MRARGARRDKREQGSPLHAWPWLFSCVLLDVPRTKTLLIIYCSETCSAPQLVHFNQSLQSWEAPWLRTNRRDVRGSGRERIPAFNIPTNSQHKQDAASLIQLRLNQSSLEKGTLRDQQCETPNYSVVSSKSAPKGRPQTGGGGGDFANFFPRRRGAPPRAPTPYRFIYHALLTDKVPSSCTFH